MFRAVGHCACASLWTCACVSLCLYVCAYVGCVAVSIRPYFCVYVPAPCLCWLTLGRSQEAPAKTTQHDQQGPLHNRLHSAAEHLTTDYTLQQTLGGNNTLSSPTCGLFISFQYLDRLSMMTSPIRIVKYHQQSIYKIIEN